MKPKLFILFSCVFISATFSSFAQAQWALDTVINTGTNTSGIAISSDGKKVVVTNKSNPGSVKIINTTDFSVTTVNTSAIENYPDGVTIAPNNSVALVTTLHKVIFINLNTGGVIGTFTAPCAGTTLYGIDVLPNGVTAVFPDMSSGCTQQGLRTIEATGSSQSSNFITISTSGILTGIAITNDGNNAIVSAFSSCGIPKNVNLSTSSVQNISGINSSYGLATFHNSNEALIYDGDTVCRVSLTTNSVTKKIAALSYNTTFQSIAISADDKYAFAMGAFDKLVISLTTNSVVQKFTAGGTNVVCNSDGSIFYVTDYYNGTVRVYKKTTSSGIQNPTAPSTGLSVYPNPGSTFMNFEMNGIELKDLKLTLCDLVGRQLMEVSPAASVTTLDVSMLTRGIYFYTVKNEKIKISGKIIVQ